MYLQLASPTFYSEWGHIYFGTKITMILRPYLPKQKLYQWFFRVPERDFINSVILPLLSWCTECSCCPNPTQRRGRGASHHTAEGQLWGYLCSGPSELSMDACAAAFLNLLKQSWVHCRARKCGVLFPTLWCLLSLGHEQPASQNTSPFS